MKKLDCRGLSCPAPVLQTKKAIEADHPAVIEVTVDNPAAVQNVSRFLEHQGYHVSLDQDGPLFRVTGTRQGDGTPVTPEIDPPAGDRQRIMVLIASNCMGVGDDTLGERLMENFIKTLKEMGDDIWRLVFVNNGVKLTIEESSVLPVLQEYARAGLQILVCGTCLDHFHLLEKKQVGETTNMLDIVTAMQLADKVINL